MAFTISEFRGKALNNAGARANLFDVTMTGASAAGLDASEFTFACKAAQIPAMAVGTIDVPYFGRVIKVPGNKTFDNWTVTIINDEDFNIRNAMEKWLYAMGTHVSNEVKLGGTFSGDKGTLYGQGTVTQYGKAGVSDTTASHTYTFVNVFPVALGEIALDWSSNDAIEEFTCEFAYDYWTHAGVVTE